MAGVAAVAAVLLLAGPTAAASSCPERLLADWRDGRIDRTYPVRCYRAALSNLPEDLKVYSSAQNDLTRALQSELTKPAASPSGGGGGNGGVSPLLVVAACAGLLAAAGSLALITR